MTGHTTAGLVATVRSAGVGDSKVPEAVRALPRALFVPPEFDQSAYQDRPIPIPHHQVTTQRSLSAWMIAALRLTGVEQVLEVGTGYGYQTAFACWAGHVGF